MTQRFPDIASIIPHSGAMRLVDEIIAMDDIGNGEVRTRLKKSAPYFRDGVWVPLWSVEIMAQSVAAVAGWHTQRQGKPRIGYLIAIDQWEEAPDRDKAVCVQPGDTAMVRVTLDCDLNPVGVYKTSIRINDRPVASALMKFIIETRENLAL